MADSIADGVYSIAARLASNQRCDIDGGSFSNKANMQLYQFNDTNAQKVLVSTVGGYRRVKFLHSSKVMDVKDAGTAWGTNVYQYEANGTPAQDWIFADMGTFIVGEESLPVERITPRVNTGLRLDAENAKTKDNTNVYIWPENGTDAQRWLFFKDSYIDNNLPVPASVGLATSETGAPGNSREISGTATLYPAWVGGAGGYQIRRRQRGRFTGTDSWSGWTSWQDVNGTTEGQGWGDPWAQTGSDTGESTTRHHVSGLSYTVDQGTYDKLETQISVRRFQENGHSTYGHTHGNAATGTVMIAFAPTVTFDRVGFSPEGLKIDYESNFLRNGNKVSLSVKVGNKTLIASFEASQLAYSGTLVIPMKKMSFVPNDRDTCEIAYKFTTIDTTISGTVSKQIEYNTGHGSTIDATFEAADGYSEIISLGTHSTSAVWLLIERGDGSYFAECESLGDGNFKIIPPLGKDYKVFCVVTDGSGWATAMISRSAMKGQPYALWNYDNGWTALRYDMSFGRSGERDHASYSTSGRPTEVVAFGKSTKTDHSVAAVLITEETEYGFNKEAFERLEKCNYAVYRTPDGDWYRVAVLETSESREHRGVIQVSISMKEVS